jgi:adenylate cyclase
MNRMLFREFRRHFNIYMVTTIAAMLLLVFSRIVLSKIFGVSDYIQESITIAVQLQFIFLMIIIGSLCLAMLSSFLDIFVIKKLIKKSSFGTILITGFVAQACMIIIVISIMRKFIQTAMTMISGSPVPPLTIYEILFIVVYLTLAIILSKFLIEMDRKLGPGNLWKVINGRFYKPREDERIFMFVDMKNSTSIAEKIGHIDFSKLLQDCFQDFAVVDHYCADIYQYVGDEVVVSWSRKEGLKNNNFLRAFFAFCEALNAKSVYYQEQYGIVPFFKAGANIGPVVVAEVGDIKREIVYHGDTLNTASRIQSKCNEFNARLLISEKLHQLIEDDKGHELEDVGCIDLIGKEKDVRLYSVSQK